MATLNVESIITNNTESEGKKLFKASPWGFLLFPSENGKQHNLNKYLNNLKASLPILPLYFLSISVRHFLRPYIRWSHPEQKRILVEEMLKKYLKVSRNYHLIKVKIVLSKFIFPFHLISLLPGSEKRTIQSEMRSYKLN